MDERSTRAVSADGQYRVFLDKSGYWIVLWVCNGWALPYRDYPDAPEMDAATVLAMWEREVQGAK